LATVFLLVTLAAPLAAQEAPGSGDRINLFFDCQGMGCWDMDFFRREIPWVNWVRDREDSDVHVLVTSQTTGGGGQQYTLAFIGRGDFLDEDQSLEVSTSGDATDDEVRRALAARLALGLGRYVAGTPMADRFEVRPMDPGSGGPGGAGGPGGPPPADEHDPWNYWVFTARLNGNLFGESSYKSVNLNNSLSANRTTDLWKVNLSGQFSRNTQTYDLEDGTDEYTRESWSSTGLVVRSVSDRFSLGARAQVGRNSYYNEDLRWSVSPGAEFNIFPYSESSRRSLTLQGLMNVRHWDYTEETIFFEDAETRVAPSLTAALSLVQPWGRMEVSATHSRYLHDTSKWQTSVFAFFDVRLFKGFSVNMFGNYGWIRDQLYLPITDYSEAEILLRQRALATSFTYQTFFGISYRFGSIFNNVVNPRFGGGNNMVFIG
jgi:hypothetical protein